MKTQQHKNNKPALFDRPFALSIGPQRAGTSWLDRYLRKRQDICVPDEVKEIFFFDRHYDRGVAFYTSHFAPKKHHDLVIEITTTSFDHEGAAQRVLDTCGTNVILICPLRNPIVRSYSLYMHYLRYGIVHGTLQEACEQNPQIIQSSYYAKHLTDWFETFGSENIKILFQEDLEKNQDQYIQSACDGLGIEYAPLPEELTDRFNATTYSKSGHIAQSFQTMADILRRYKLYFVINFAKKIGLKPLIFGNENPDAKNTTIPPEDRKWLEERLNGEVEKLESMIGPIPQWKGQE